MIKLKYMDNRISAIILTKNSQNTIIDCLESVLFCDEIIIVDDNSSDNTLDLVSSFKRKSLNVYKRNLENDFSSQRNFALSKVNTKWAIFVDSDEVVTRELMEKIKKVLSVDLYDGYYIKRVDYIWGKKLIHGETGAINLLRMAKVKNGAWVGKVHESWKVSGSISNIDQELMHFPHQSVAEFISEIDYYTTLRAEELCTLGVKANWFLIIMYPFSKFFLNYFLRLGFLDGVHGFVSAIIMSGHSFLVRAKLFQLQKKKFKPAELS